MAKPKKSRFVLEPPSVVYFKPRGIPVARLEEVVLAVEEYEAVRLVDYEGLQQQEAAERMHVSRATCARILDSARATIAEALTEGKSIRIEGGSFVLGRNRFRCRECDDFWTAPLDATTHSAKRPVCPRCRSDKIVDLGREAGLPARDAGPGPGRGGRSGRGRGRGAHSQDSSGR